MSSATNEAKICVVRRKEEVEALNKQLETSRYSQGALASQCTALEESNEKLAVKLDKLQGSAEHAKSEIERLEELIEQGKALKEQLKSVKKEVGGDEKELIKLTAMAEKMSAKTAVTCRERCVEEVGKRKQAAAVWFAKGAATDSLCFECEKSTEGKLVVECEVCKGWLCAKCAGIDPRTPPGDDDNFLCPDSLCNEIKPSEVKKWERLNKN